MNEYEVELAVFLSTCITVKVKASSDKEAAELIKEQAINYKLDNTKLHKSFSIVSYGMRNQWGTYLDIPEEAKDKIAKLLEETRDEQNKRQNNRTNRESTG